MKAPDFVAHNIRLDNGTYTISAEMPKMEAHPWLLSSLRVLDVVFPGQKKGRSLVDLGCLEGGYAVEFARAGFDVTAIDVRAENIAACQYVKSRLELPQLRFVQDDVLNLSSYGPFDITFCSGLLYHLNNPRAFLSMIGKVTNRVLLLQTHFAPSNPNARKQGIRNKLYAALGRPRFNYRLSPLTENEGLPGRWYREFKEDRHLKERDNDRLASWENWRSFWLTRPALLQSLKDAGFDLVFEQYDNLEPSIIDSIHSGFYGQNYRSTFVGIKSAAAEEARR